MCCTSNYTYCDAKKPVYTGQTPGTAIKASPYQNTQLKNNQRGERSVYYNSENTKNGESHYRNADDADSMQKDKDMAKPKIE